MEESVCKYEEKGPFFDRDRRIRTLDLGRAEDGNTSEKSSLITPQYAAKIRDVLIEIKNISVKVGGEVLKLGTKISEIVYNVIKRFPNTVVGLLFVVLCII